jgi:hypothetical protein
VHLLKLQLGLVLRLVALCNNVPLSAVSVMVMKVQLILRLLIALEAGERLQILHAEMTRMSVVHARPAPCLRVVRVAAALGLLSR